MPAPQPPSGTPRTNPGGVADLKAKIASSYGSAAAAKWVQLCASLPDKPYKTILSVWGLWIAENSIGHTVAAGTKGVAGFTNTAATATSDTLGGFNLSNWFVRVGEILLGVVLIGVGVAHISGSQNIISRAVGKVPMF